MAGPIAVDTPDYQRGIVSAQKQLAFLNNTSDTVTVGVPPNAETLVVATPTNGLLSTPVCSGLTTALNYPAVRIGGFLGALGAIHWMFDISSALDAQVQIKWAGANLEQWWVYADSGVRLTVNPTQTSNQLGQQYVIPTVPSTVTGDHPPVELQHVTFDGVANNTDILAAPGAGQRYRVFYVTSQCTSAGGAGGLIDLGSGLSICTNRTISDIAPTHVDYKPSGLPLSDGAGVRWESSGAAGTGTIVYTLETV